MVCYIEMKDPATVVTQNDQNKQDLKARSWFRLLVAILENLEHEQEQNCAEWNRYPKPADVKRAWNRHVAVIRHPDQTLH